MTDTEKTKFEKVGRQAMNIQVIEATFACANSDGKPVEGTQRRTAFIYNLENISTAEVEELLNNGNYEFDDRILEADPARLANIFPHKGEADVEYPPAVWKPAGDSRRQCSICGFKARGQDVIKDGNLVYRYCPVCSSTMQVEVQDIEERKDENG